MEKDGKIQKTAHEALEDKVTSKKTCSKCKVYKTVLKCTDCKR